VRSWMTGSWKKEERKSLGTLLDCSYDMLRSSLRLAEHPAETQRYQEKSRLSQPMPDLFVHG
ncbi:hypothetical protein, partial [Pseudomonas aeruginosa]|uniref:hypothetical protein n=1 Tax=Pseudomonas aeruginosa TaxID=287 RepID=UPI001A9D4469